MLKFREPVSAYTMKLPIMGQQDPHNRNVLRFWVDVPRTYLIASRFPRLVLLFAMVQLWRAACKQDENTLNGDPYK
jgi:hypothetical protein